MSKLDYRHIDLDGATLVQRSHKRQVTPPGMWSVENMYLSRSDNNPSLRPDCSRGGHEIYGISGNVIEQTSDVLFDVLNSVTGLYGSSSLVYITSYIPFGSYEGGDSVLSDTLTTGTATGSSGSFHVTLNDIGVDFDLQVKAWRGQLISIEYLPGIYLTYTVDSVFSSSPGDPTSSGVLTLTSPLISSVSGDDFILYYNHNPFRASKNKVDIQQNGASLIYATPDISDAISADDISGPFFANISEAEWRYKVQMYYMSSGGNGEDCEYQHTLATNGVKWFKTIYDPGTRRYAYWDALPATLEENDAWTYYASDHIYHSGTDTYVLPRTLKRNDYGRGITSGADGKNKTTSVVAPAVAWTTDSGDNWNYEFCDGYDSDWKCQGFDDDGSVMTAVMWKESTDTIELRYSVNDGASWSDTNGVNTWTGANVEYAKIQIVNSIFVVTGGNGYIYYSADGMTFTAKDVSADASDMTVISDIAYNNGDGGTDYFVATSPPGHIARSQTLGGTWADVTPTFGYWTPSTPSPYSFVLYDIRSGRFVIPDRTALVWSTDYGATWNTSDVTSVDGANYSYAPSNLDITGSQMCGFWNTSTIESGAPPQWGVSHGSSVVAWDTDKFKPVSDSYRSNSVAVMEGYTVLVGTREWENPDATGFDWYYHPRRIRWSVAGSPVDFSGTGSGTGDLRGSGALLRAIPVNGRIVIFETVAVGALVPRGDSTDPWDYDIIDEHFKFLSNPIAVGDVCYIVGSDGLLYTTDGISEMKELGASFDLSEFDDFDETKPAWLIFSREFNSIFCYYRDWSGSAHPAYMISVANGGVSQINLSHFDETSDSPIEETPGSIVSIQNSDVQELILSYNAVSGTATKMRNCSYKTGYKITGIDTVRYNISGDTTEYFSGMLETGELYITEEGSKCSVKHLLVETYTSASSTDNSDRPYLAAEVKSIEDSDFVTPGDTVGTATMTDAALTGSGTAWSNTIAAGDDIETVFTLPCQGKQARVYIDSTLQVSGTDYTISGNDITLSAPLATGEVLYAYWDACPEVKVKVGDMFKSAEGWHRVTAITDATNITLDHYLSTGSETVTHYPAWQLDDGHGRTEIGINRLVEGVQIRLYIIPEYNSTQQSEIVKITGLSIGYVPQGRKILKATGS